METKYKIISADQARLFSDLLLPYVLEDKDFDNFWFYIAIQNDRVVGMLAESGTKAMPEILSIGVSPKYKRHGIGKGLLSFAVQNMTERIPEAEAGIPNAISARLVAPVGHMEPLKHFFESEGFETESESQYYKVPVDMLDLNPVVQNEKSIEKVEKLKASKKLLSLDEVSPIMVKSFAKKMIEEGFLATLDIGLLDEKLSYFVCDGDDITGAILFKKEEEGVLQNLLLYSDPEKLPSAMTGYLLTVAATEALSRPSTDRDLMFWIGEDETQKLITKVFPHAKPETEVCVMERVF